MLKLLTKTTPWMVASLLVAASGFGQTNSCCPPPKPKPQCCEPVKCEKVCPPVCPIQLIPAYNHPAGIETRCSWDVWVDASFTYWQALQDNMEIGISDSELNGTLTTTSGITNGHVVDMGFKYKPGFKVGGGVKFDHDDWDAHAEYTWFRSNVSAHSNGPTSTSTAFGLIFPMVGAPNVMSTRVWDSVSGHWRCNMDILDATMGRWYYVGTKLTFHPYAGVRAQWIRQRFKVTYTNTTGFAGFSSASTYAVSDKTTSWGVGPEMGIDMNWNIGEGFRLYSCGEADVCYTRYNGANTSESLTITATNVSTPFHVKQKHVGRLRAHMDLEMGLGWGTYLDCNNWYLDLAAGYGFQVFWDQNMFRMFVDDFMRGKSFMPNGNLYVHGLTATIALHF